MARLQSLKLRVNGKKGSLDIYKQLKGEAFTEYHSFFTLCVSIGFKNSKRVKNFGKEQLFWSDTFSIDEYAAFNSIIIRVAKESDYSMLNKGEEFLQILEEYANGGLDIILESDIFKKIFVDLNGKKILQIRKQDFLPKQLMSYIYSLYQNSYKKKTD